MAVNPEHSFKFAQSRTPAPSGRPASRAATRRRSGKRDHLWGLPWHFSKSGAVRSGGPLTRANNSHGRRPSSWLISGASRRSSSSAARLPDGSPCAAHLFVVAAADGGLDEGDRSSSIHFCWALHGAVTRHAGRGRCYCLPPLNSPLSASPPHDEHYLYLSPS